MGAVPQFSIWGELEEEGLMVNMGQSDTSDGKHRMQMAMKPYSKSVMLSNQGSK